MRLATLAIFIACCVTACSPEKAKSPEKTEKVFLKAEVLPTEATLDEIEDAYQVNAIEASVKFKNGPLVIQGDVFGIYEWDGGSCGVSIQCKTKVGPGRAFFCFGAQHSASLAKLRKGQSVRLVGHLEHYRFGEARFVNARISGEKQ